MRNHSCTSLMILDHEKVKNRHPGPVFVVLFLQELLEKIFSKKQKILPPSNQTF